MRRYLGAAWPAGLAAGGIFVVMGVLIFNCVAPTVADGFTPQAAWRGYDALALEEFGRTLTGDPAETYRLTLLWLDTGFILLFAAWAVGVFLTLRGAARWILLEI